MSEKQVKAQKITIGELKVVIKNLREQLANPRYQDVSQMEPAEPSKEAMKQAMAHLKDGTAELLLIPDKATVSKEEYDKLYDIYKNTVHENEKLKEECSSLLEDRNSLFTEVEKFKGHNKTLQELIVTKEGGFNDLQIVNLGLQNKNANLIHNFEVSQKKFFKLEKEYFQYKKQAKERDQKLVKDLERIKQMSVVQQPPHGVVLAEEFKKKIEGLNLRKEHYKIKYLQLRDKMEKVVTEG